MKRFRRKLKNKDFIAISKEHSVTLDKTRRLIIIKNRIEKITALNVERAIKAILKNGSGPIIIMITGPGGEVFASFEIYHIIKKYRLQETIVTVGYGDMVRSGALSILQAGTLRFLSAKTTLTMHQTESASMHGTKRNAPAHLYYFNLLSIMDGQQLHILSERGRPIKTMYELFTHDASLSPRNALKLKLVDEVIKARSIKDIYKLVLSRLKKKK